MPTELKNIMLKLINKIKILKEQKQDFKKITKQEQKKIK